MRACVVVFPGSNADTEMIHALRGVCGVPTTVAWHTDTALPGGTDLVAIPGGFSYGDYLRTGAIAKVSPIEGAGPFTRTAGEVWRLPVAHGEGRFQADAATLERLDGEGLVGLRYCTAAGAIEDRANPNGSLRSIAGIYGGPRKNVFGLMPHPERMSEAFLGGADGKKLFDAVLAAA